MRTIFRATSTPGSVDHHFECERDHHVQLLRFDIDAGPMGSDTTYVPDCMLYEIEDEIRWQLEAHGAPSIEDQGWELLDEDVRSFAAEVDALDLGEVVSRTFVYDEVS